MYTRGGGNEVLLGKETIIRSVVVMGFSVVGGAKENMEKAEETRASRREKKEGR